MPYDPERHGPVRIVGPGFRERVRAVVAEVPEGRLTTYGDVAGFLGSRSVARQVGFALAALPEGSDVPWHRVVRSGGRLSTRADGVPSPEQRARLEAEGVPLDEAGRVLDFDERRYDLEEVELADA